MKGHKRSPQISHWLYVLRERKLFGQLLYPCKVPMQGTSKLMVSLYKQLLAYGGLKKWWNFKSDCMALRMDISLSYLWTFSKRWARGTERREYTYGYRRTRGSVIDDTAPRARKLPTSKPFRDRLHKLIVRNSFSNVKCEAQERGRSKWRYRCEPTLHGLSDWGDCMRRFKLRQVRITYGKNVFFWNWNHA